MKNHGTLPAESGAPCSCCGRTHRKLIARDGFWMGKQCLADYEVFCAWPRRDHPVWYGHEKVYDKVAQMVQGR